MDIKIIFIKTSKGEDESNRITNHLSSDIKRALGLIDNKSTVKELMKRAAPSLREALGDMLQELLDGGFIQDQDKVSNVVKMAIPRMPIQKNIIPSLNFEGLGERQSAISVMSVSVADALAVEETVKKEAARIRIEQEAVNLQAKAEVVRLKVKQEAEKAKAEQEAELAKVKIEVERVRFKAEQEIEKIKVELEGALVKAREEAEALAKARFEAEAARFKAEQQEVEQAKAKMDAEAKVRAEAKVFRLKVEHEAVKAKAEQEAVLAKANVEAETARFKAQQETEKVRAELEGALLKTKEEAEALVKARSEAEAARLKVEQEGIKIRAKQEAIQTKVEAEAKARAVVEAMYLKVEKDVVKIKAQQEAEQAKTKGAMEAAVNARADAEKARLKAEQEMSKVRLELEAEQVKSQVEAKAKARAEAETARLKGEQEAARIILKQEAAQAKAKIEMDAKVRSEAEVTRLKEEQEAIRVKAEHLATLNKEKAEVKAREEAAARIKIEKDAGKIRAEHEVMQTVAKAKTEAVVKAQAVLIPEMKAVQHAAITPSKLLPWSKIAAGLIVLLFILAAVLPYIWPMQSYVTQIEQKLSAQLQQPVHISYLRVTLLPQPKLELEGVSVGGSQELKASKVVLNFGFFALFNETKAIHSLEIDNLILNAESFDKTLMWLQAAGGDIRYPVARMVLQRARLSDDELSLPPVDGVVIFDGQGHFAKASLKSVDGKLSMELQPQQARWQIVLAINKGYVPLLPDMLFNELTVKGELGAGEIKFHEIDGRLYGGLLTGSARLTWLKGWKMQGLVNIKAMELHDVLPQVDIAGEMSGDANFILHGEKLPLLAKTPHLDGKFLVKKGLINKFDLVETSRMPTRKGASSGRTHFDELSGVLEIDNNKQHLRQIKISAGVMSANGYVDVAANRQLSGRLNVDLKIRADLGSVPLVLSGTLNEPVWSTRR
ncbi:MAG: AsmA-like C-terminal region [Candidatus Nitrotoga sp. SPKER]|nr:MAG: AsmA-like C-terminal region [Candidatus Nitrotoga sp. SPKER]